MCAKVNHIQGRCNDYPFGGAIPLQEYGGAKFSVGENPLNGSADHLLRQMMI